jgi:hypothetical protein
MKITRSQLKEIIIEVLLESSIVEKKRRRKRKDPAKGTGKKPKGSGRRLYTDEKTKARLKKAFEYAKQRKEASKRKTQRLRKKKNENY